MIELFLSLHLTLLRFLFYWTIYILYVTICFIFELKLSMIEFLIPIIFELSYLSITTIITIKLYLISSLFNILWYLLSTPFIIISNLVTSIASITSQLYTSIQATSGYIIIGAMLILVILNIWQSDHYDDEQYVQPQWYQVKHRIPQNKFKKYYFPQDNYSYFSRNSYSTHQSKSYSQNRRQQTQKTNRQVEEEERKKRLTQELKENRETIRLLYQNKVEIYQLKKNKEINRAVFKDAIDIFVQRIEVLQEEGKELFLNLINIQDGVCRVDFHNFYKNEIKLLLDGILEKIRLYKFQLGYRQVKLKIIVGKGNHSKNGIPVIGPLTQEYLKEYLQEEVDITNGFIEVQV